jgi:hypothetical protein
MPDEHMGPTRRSPHRCRTGVGAGEDGGDREAVVIKVAVAYTVFYLLVWGGAWYADGPPPLYLVPVVVTPIISVWATVIAYEDTL